MAGAQACCFEGPQDRILHLVRKRNSPLDKVVRRAQVFYSRGNPVDRLGCGRMYENTLEPGFFVSRKLNGVGESIPNRKLLCLVCLHCPIPLNNGQ